MHILKTVQNGKNTCTRPLKHTRVQKLWSTQSTTQSTVAMFKQVVQDSSTMQDTS